MVSQCTAASVTLATVSHAAPPHNPSPAVPIRVAARRAPLRQPQHRKGPPPQPRAPVHPPQARSQEETEHDTAIEIARGRRTLDLRVDAADVALVIGPIHCGGDGHRACACRNGAHGEAKQTSARPTTSPHIPARSFSPSRCGLPYFSPMPPTISMPAAAARGRVACVRSGRRAPCAAGTRHRARRIGWLGATVDRLAAVRSNARAPARSRGAPPTPRDQPHCRAALRVRSRDGGPAPRNIRSTSRTEERKEQAAKHVAALALVRLAHAMVLEAVLRGRRRARRATARHGAARPGPPQP